LVLGVALNLGSGVFIWFSGVFIWFSGAFTHYLALFTLRPVSGQLFQNEFLALFTLFCRRKGAWETKKVKKWTKKRFLSGKRRNSTVFHQLER
jgi:hypothetical protein